MTSHIIESLANRARELERRAAQSPPGTFAESAAHCTFCSIIAGKEPALRVLDTEHVVVVMDILPIRPGHVLVIPKQHIARVSELPEEVAGHIGQAVTRVAKALTLAMENTGLNVVCNQEYAQAVPHVHFHIVPAPLSSAPSRGKPLSKDDLPPAPTDAAQVKGSPYGKMLNAEFQARDELDDEAGARLADMIKAKM